MISCQFLRPFSTTVAPKQSQGETADVQAGRRERQVWLQFMLKLKASSKQQELPLEYNQTILENLYLLAVLSTGQRAFDATNALQLS